MRKGLQGPQSGVVVMGHPNMQAPWGRRRSRCLHLGPAHCTWRWPGGSTASKHLPVGIAWGPPGHKLPAGRLHFLAAHFFDVAPLPRHSAFTYCKQRVMWIFIQRCFARAWSCAAPDAARGPSHLVEAQRPALWRLLSHRCTQVLARCETVLKDKITL